MLGTIPKRCTGQTRLTRCSVYGSQDFFDGDNEITESRESSPNRTDEFVGMALVAVDVDSFPVVMGDKVKERS